jgi:hypothetical protein
LSLAKWRERWVLGSAIVVEPLWVISGTFRQVRAVSALPPIADMCGATREVRFGPEADMSAEARSF